MSATLLNNIEAAIGSIGRGFASAPVTLGSVTLTGVEVPSEFIVGGQQQVVVHKLPGGDRVINAIGNDPNRLTLSGMFTGPNTAARYQAVAAMRQAGTQQKLSVLGQAVLAVIVGFSYTITQRGAVVPYTIELEVIPQLAATQSTAGTSALSSLIGPDAASALSSVTSTIATAATYVQNTVGQAETIVGEVTPIAALVGAGGALAAAGNYLTAASALSGAGTNIAGAPATLASFVTSMQGAGASLASTVTSASGSLDGMAGNAANGVCVDAPSLMDAAAQAQVLAGSVQAGGFVNRSLSGAAQAAGQSAPAPVVTS